MKAMIFTIALFSVMAPVMAQAGIFTNKVADAKGSCISADGKMTASYRRRVYVVKGSFVGERGDVYDKVELNLKNEVTGKTLTFTGQNVWDHQENRDVSYMFDRDILNVTLKHENNKAITLRCNFKK